MISNAGLQGIQYGIYLGSEGQIHGLSVNIHRRHNRRSVPQARKTRAAVDRDKKAAANISS